MSNTPSNNFIYAVLILMLFAIVGVGGGALVAFIFHSVGG
jgi:hypothetical protein